MIAKWKVNLLLALSTFTLVGVGFSSWVIIAQPFNEIGSTKVDTILEENPYINFDTTKGTNNTGIDYLEYLKDGFRLDGVASNSGTITIYLVMNLDNCRANFQDKTNTVRIDAKLYYYSNKLDSFNIFRNCTGVYSVNIEGTSTSVTGMATSNDGYVVMPLSYTFTDILSSRTDTTFSFSISYRFTPISGLDFATQVYPYLLNSSFVFEIGLEGVF